MAKYFAQRGWVAISINYRLKRDVGTVPQEWLDEYPELNPYYRFRFLSVYPAIRDAKAAVRWVVANADKYHMDTDYITVGGGSAGAVIAIALGVTNEEDYRDELRLTQDPTLATTNIDKSYQIKTILNFWGHKKAVEFLEIVYGHRRFDSTDAPILIAHGTDDSVIPLRRAKELRAIYEHHGAPYVYYSLEGYGHSAWDAIVDGKSLGDLSLEFMVEQQALTLKTDQ